MNIVLVEDSELIRSQLLRILAQHERLHVVGVCGEEAVAIEMILGLMPDAILLDLSLSPGSGLNVLRHIRSMQCASRVLVLTNNNDEAIRTACQSFGVSGFYDKSNQAEECLQQLLAWLPPIPSNENSRLSVLRETRLLDSPTEETFDDITRLARDIAETPIALVSLVDENRQWFLSRQGLDVTETSRTIAFCAHAIESNDMFEVENANQDPRFRDNPLVVGNPHIRFYAGIPLVLTSGEILGTLCVLDTESRSLTSVQKSGLKTLARAVVSEIELRKKMRSLEQEVILRKEAELLMTDLAMKDSLTSLPNRASLLDRLGQQLRLASRTHTMCAFMFVDLNRFKQINDTWGHDVGDTVLVYVANSVRDVLRESDTVARLGGDEFAIILPDVNNETAAMQMAEKINAALKKTLVINGAEVTVSASIGVSLFPNHADSVDAIMRNADFAMYESKHHGGAQPCMYSDEFGVMQLDLLSLENDLKHAVERNEIFAYYQPQICPLTGDVVGVEALARWIHPKLGFVAPQTFISLAERMKIIGEIGARMLNLALTQLSFWDSLGIRIPQISINASALELTPDYTHQVMMALDCNGIASSRLEIEITESLISDSEEQISRVLHSLRAAGIAIAIDDFGVGYSSLSRLKELPVDTIKLDKSFVDDVVTNVHDSAIVKAIVTIAKDLGLRTIAEGVENFFQKEMLVALGCDHIQGYFYSKPLSPELFLRWASEQDSLSKNDLKILVGTDA